MVAAFLRFRYFCKEDLDNVFNDKKICTEPGLALNQIDNSLPISIRELIIYLLDRLEFKG